MSAAPSPLAHATMQRDLDRLARQRDAYAMALTSAADGRARLRHERTIARLDEEIDALREAVARLEQRPAVIDDAPWPFVGRLEQTAEIEPEPPLERDELPPTPARWPWLVAIAAVAAAIIAAWS